MRLDYKRVGKHSKVEKPKEKKHHFFRQEHKKGKGKWIARKWTRRRKTNRGGGSLRTRSKLQELRQKKKTDKEWGVKKTRFSQYEKKRS